MMSGRMEWSLDTESKAFDGKTEAQFMAQSIADVSRHYGAGLLDQKTVDWMNLCQCLAIVYGGRIVAIKMTPRAKPTPRKPTPQETAKNFSQPSTTSGSLLPDNLFTFDTPPDQMNGASHVGEVAGIGDVVFPDDHPLSPNFKPKMN